MRWLVLVLALSLVYGATAKRECHVSEFAEIAYSIHDPRERYERILIWLDDSGPYCTKEQLVTVYSNLAQALGTSDNMRLRAKIEQLWGKAK